MKKLFIGSLLILFTVFKTYCSDEQKKLLPTIEKEGIAAFYEQYKNKNETAIFEYYSKNQNGFVALKDYCILRDPEIAREALHDEKVADGQKEHCDKEYKYKKWQMFAYGCATGLTSTVMLCGIYFLVRAPQLVWNTVKPS